jgi:hypothetical protein
MPFFRVVVDWPGHLTVSEEAKFYEVIVEARTRGDAILSVQRELVIEHHEGAPKAHEFTLVECVECDGLDREPEPEAKD